MDDFNKKNEPINNEEVKDLLKTVAIYEAKSAVAKLKLAKYAAVKGVETIGKGTKKLGEFIDQRRKKKR